ncbi:unnamed protein product [Linum tenue]|uniref:Protein kinase domain-containing protein n=1 Tax=Linum tenue TaxID=586396 RepID=A0AAV0IVR6_9ROSI|nr:unnamed protein product [Linum tenue]
MGLLRTIRRLYGILNYPRRNEVGGNFGMSFETPDLFISLSTLQVATNFFSKKNVIGQGGFGRVYKGLMPNGQEIAVKKLSSNSTPGVIEFTNEVKLLSEIRYLNLVTLLGCCVEVSDKMLVYEYLPNKSLDCFLFDKEKSSSLDWTTRFNIAKGVARGILYLHEEAPMKIIHRDIKASNILLDESLNPKISDFGLARLCPEEDSLMSTRVSGTHGYMAPEYAMHGYLSVKTDIFSYGILLLEIISGRRSLDRRLSTDHADLANFLSFHLNFFYLAFSLILNLNAPCPVMDLIRTFSRYLDGIMNSRGIEKDGDRLSPVFETSDLSAGLQTLQVAPISSPSRISSVMVVSVHLSEVPENMLVYEYCQTKALIASSLVNISSFAYVCLLCWLLLKFYLLPQRYGVNHETRPPACPL